MAMVSEHNATGIIIRCHLDSSPVRVRKEEQEVPRDTMHIQILDRPGARVHDPGDRFMTLERSYGDRFMIRAREIVTMDRAQRILCGEYGEGSTWLWIRQAQGLLSRARWIEFWAEERLFSNALTRILD